MSRSGETVILIVEDEQPVREMVRFSLSRAGFEVCEAADCLEAHDVIAGQHPDLILMDWMLPEMSGLEFTRRLKRDPETVDIPVIILTARGEEEDKVKGLNTGADDYVTKPFSTRELTARINAVLRRSAPPGDAVIEAGDLLLDADSHRVIADGTEVKLGPTEFRLLHFFMTNQERVHSRARLLHRVWRGNVDVEERTVDVHIRRLRKALQPYGLHSFIQTVRGTGYRFSTRVD
ncbi:MAG: phosphate regulon transcriptional regulator PhoB [Gammaproteobacteria bacterium]|nr:phosphate regulon transcriptional regulator PhoB [Gammaproteobacteria bacterium]NNF61406.1 phosphate regulon transcriptional regulator PhoB [Gammaproteobacteria bacterium]